MAMLSITDILTNEKIRTQNITWNQQEEFETLLDAMNNIVIASVNFGITADKLSPQTKQVEFSKANRLLLNDDVNVRSDFLTNRCYSDAFGLASSFAELYIRKNPSRRIDGVITRTHNVPEWEDRQINLSRSLQYWLAHAGVDGEEFHTKCTEQISTGIIGALDMVFLVTDPSKRSIHWKSCFETIVAGFNEENSNNQHLCKPKGSVEVLVKKYMDGIVHSNNVFLHEINRIVSEDAELASQIERKISMPLFANIDRHGDDAIGVDLTLEFNIKSITDKFDGWELSEANEEGSEICLLEPEPMTETEYSDELTSISISPEAMEQHT